MEHLNCSLGRALSRLRIYDPQLIIYGLDEVLLHAEIFLSGLD
jgi:hypothetical protein